MKNTYLNIHIEGEKTEIGVLNIGSFNKFFASLKAVQNEMRSKVEEKLVEALKEHFVCEIKVVMSYITKHNPLEFQVDVVICSEDEDRLAAVYLKETWVY